MDLSKLASLFGGGGGPSSSTSQASPFYNDAGIYFDSPGAGGIEAGPVIADSSPRQTSGGIQALPDSQLYSGSNSQTGGDSYLYLIIAGIVALGLVVYLLFKK